MNKIIIATKNAPPAVGPYSQAVKIGNMLYLSGQIPLKSDGGMETGDIKAQSIQVLTNLKAVLEAGGSSLQQVVKCTCFLNDMNSFTAFNEVYATFFTSDYPARSTFQVARLPRDVLVEVEAIALAE
ncbi:MAG: RidA family protein [Trueperaceae bacterium]